MTTRKIAHETLKDESKVVSATDTVAPVVIDPMPTEHPARAALKDGTL